MTVKQAVFKYKLNKTKTDMLFLFGVWVVESSRA